MDSQRRIDRQIRAYYEDRSDEGERLRKVSGWLEFERTKELIDRHMPPGRQRILDVGGAAGIYAGWLATQGHEVHLVDPIQRHVDEARAYSERLEHQFTSCLGDARALDVADESVDVVLLMGPLYHLTERSDRIQAFAEARRALRPGGIVFAAAISRFSTLFSGLSWGLLADTQFELFVEGALQDGQHRNPADEQGWFTTAYFHHPDELESEAREASFRIDGLFGIEGMPGWITAATDIWQEERYRRLLLTSARATESEPSLRGLSSHMLLVGRRSG